VHVCTLSLFFLTISPQRPQSTQRKKVSFTLSLFFLTTLREFLTLEMWHRFVLYLAMRSIVEARKKRRTGTARPLLKPRRRWVGFRFSVTFRVFRVPQSKRNVPLTADLPHHKIRMSHWSLIALIALASIGLYANTLGNAFLWDDKFLIVQNPHIQSLHHLPSLFASDFSAPSDVHGKSGYYRPATMVSYAADYVIWGMNPRGFHLTNVLVHALNAGLVYALTFLLFRDRLASALAGLIFVLHPIHTESVAWVSGRTDLLCASFLLLAFLSFARISCSIGWRQTAHRFASPLLFLFALWSKETAIVLPVLLLSYDGYFGPKVPPSYRGKRHVIYWIVAALYLLSRVLVLGGVGPAMHRDRTLYIAFLTTVKISGLYLKHLFYPIPLNAELDMALPASLFEVPVLLSLLAGVALVVALLRTAKTSKSVSFGMLLPVLQLIPLQEWVAERFLYLPSIGFVVVLSGLLSRAYRLTSRHWAKTLMVVGITVLMAMCACIIKERNRDWKDEITLYSATIRDAPDSPRAHYNLGTIYLGQKQYDRAIPLLRQATHLRPGYVQALYNLACAHALKGEKKSAMQALRQAVRKGLRDPQILEGDPDLESLKNDPGFQALIRRLRAMHF